MSQVMTNAQVADACDTLAQSLAVNFVYGEVDGFFYGVFTRGEKFAAISQHTGNQFTFDSLGETLDKVGEGLGFVASYA